MLQHRVLRARRHNPDHATNRPDQTDTEDNPGVSRHYSEGCAGTEEVAGTEGGEGETAAGVLEGGVEVGLFGGGEGIAGFTVEEAIDDDYRSRYGTLFAVTGQWVLYTNESAEGIRTAEIAKRFHPSC